MAQVASPCGSTVVDIVDDAELQQAVEATIDATGMTADELRRQAVAGRFTSERARRAWFVVSPFMVGR